MEVSHVCVCVHVSAMSWQAAWGKERPDGYYANEASCLLHRQTLHSSLLVLLEVRKYRILVRHIPSPLLYFLREGRPIYSNSINTLLSTFACYSPVSAWLSICTLVVITSFFKCLLTPSVQSKVLWGSESISRRKGFPWIGHILILIRSIILLHPAQLHFSRNLLISLSHLGSPYFSLRILLCPSNQRGFTGTVKWIHIQLSFLHLSLSCWCTLISTPHDLFDVVADICPDWLSI